MNGEVNKFLEKGRLFDDEQSKIAEKLRDLVFEIHPNVTEEFKYGGILFSLSENFGGIYIYKNYVSFEFSYGYKLNDPKYELEGKGKFRRHLKFKLSDDIRKSSFIFFLSQIKHLNINKE